MNLHPKRGCGKIEFCEGESGGLVLKNDGVAFDSPGAGSYNPIFVDLLSKDKQFYYGLRRISGHKGQNSKQLREWISQQGS